MTDPISRGQCKSSTSEFNGTFKSAGETEHANQRLYDRYNFHVMR
jgi:hypothetical protein